MQPIAPLASERPVRMFRPRRTHDRAALDPQDFDPPLATRLLILQPTPFCNINCDYCYLPQRDDPARMDLDTVRLAARRLREDGLLGDTLTVVWHAGEPLLLPPAWYAAAFAEIAAELGSGCNIRHSIQTNATLIDEAWCRFFLDHQVQLGVSVDGPAEIHDRHRRTRSGKGSHAQVMRALAALRRHGVPHHAIAVVTADALAHADVIHDFFIAADIHQVGFNFDEAEGPHQRSSLGAAEDRHAAFVRRMLDHVLAAEGRWQVRELANAERLIRDGNPTWQWQGRRYPENGQILPFAMVTVARNGDFSTFSPELLGQSAADFDDFVLGNVHRHGYLAATRSDTFARLWAGILAGTEACRAGCAYFNYCGGGAPANKFYENGSLASAETLYCRTMFQRPFEAVLGSMERVVANSHARCGC